MEAILQIITNSTLLVTKFFRDEHPPVFDRPAYEAEVPEDEAVGTTLVSLAARDPDGVSEVRYRISEGNRGNAFFIDPATGDVILARHLDYESIKKYNLSVTASDERLDEASARVMIYVTDVNDNPPVFDRPIYRATVMEEEDERDLPRKILQVGVTDADSDPGGRGVVFSLSGEGIDVQSPGESHFVVDPTSGEIFVRKVVDRDPPGGRPEWTLTVFAQDEGGKGLVGHSGVIVTVKDINDSPPVFKQAAYQCNVTENGEAGIFVAQIEAEDHDDPSEGANAKVTYSITRNAIDESTGGRRLVFDIDAASGQITTRICCLDRERTTQYSLRVVAMDGGGLNGTATVDVFVLDTNDSPPRFTKDFWKAEVEESVEPSIPDRTILNVTVLDDDETNDFYFEIPEAYKVASDMFTIEAIGDGIGAIRLAKPLNFEDPSQRLGFEFQIVVSDVGDVLAEARTASAWVEIRIKDVNDNAPVFKEDSIEVNVSEKMIIGSAISTFVATDVDNEGRGKISYTIDPKSDKMGHFSVSNEGTVKLLRPLDRETISRHLIFIKASDDGIPQKTSTANLIVNVLDENDNAPRFSRAYFPILPENQPSRKLIEVSAVDDDDATRGNGPPFHFALDISSSTAEIQALFSVEHNATGDNGQGMAVVSSLGSFDREMQKEYHLPIVIVDSGHPPMTGTSTLVITIGDENDNLMRPGEKRVSVYTHKSISQETQIGRIYVHDPDDWDLVDKTFNWNGKPHPNFILDEDSGMITMLAATRSGEYLLEFLVHDHKHSQDNVKANVTVSVIYIPKRVVQQAASLRIANITDEFFIQTWYYLANDSVPSKADLFRREISEMVNTDADNVHIFSLKLGQSRPPVTDVRFTVFDGHYFEAGLLSALLMEQKNDIETKLGISITMIGINECLDESVPCDGSCTSKLVISDEPYLVDANRTSVVGVNVNVIPECACQVIDFSTANVKKQIACYPYPCKNRGKCIREKDGTRCACPKGLRGPRCQMLTMTFEGNGYSWFPSLATCDKNHISVEFVTVCKHGLIFYNDALALSQEKGHFTSDFILLEIENGQLRLLTDYGSGTIQLRVNGTGNLADGRWHRVDLFLDTRSVSVEVDHCMTAIVQEPHEQLKGMFDTSSCRSESQVPPYSRYLNLNGPLQVGGIRQYTLQRNPKSTFTPSALQPFSGCIRNLMLNGHFYDFSQPLLHKNISWKCKPFEEICRGNKGTESNDSFESCSHGTCEGSFHHPVCVCDPGWTGRTCSERTVPAYFGNVSYVKYALSFKPNTYSMNIQLRFRTWELAGVLLHVANQYNQEFGTLQIEDSRLLFRFNTNSHSKEEQIVQLSHVNVSDGEWHLAAVARIGVIVILSLDEGDGNWYNESYRSDSSHLLMDVDLQEGVIVGGKVRYSGVDQLTVDKDYRQGCIDDIRLDGHPLPLPPNSNGTRWAQAVVFQNVIENCISQDQCINVECLAPFVCKNLWMKHECSCKEGSVLSNNHMKCVQIDVCFHDPCMNGGTCYIQGTSYACSCSQGSHGRNCQWLNESTGSRLALGVAAFVVSCLIIIIIGLMVFVVYRKRLRRRRTERCQMKRPYYNAGGNSRLKEAEDESVSVSTTLDLTAIAHPTVTDHCHEEVFTCYTSDAVKGSNLSSVDVIRNIKGTKPSELLPNILQVERALCGSSANRQEGSAMVSRLVKSSPEALLGLSAAEGHTLRVVPDEGRDLRS